MYSIPFHSNFFIFFLVLCFGFGFGPGMDGGILESGYVYVCVCMYVWMYVGYIRGDGMIQMVGEGEERGRLDVGNGEWGMDGILL